jgi:hypothetical protein
MMTKPWHERPLWERLYLADDPTYRDVAVLIGHAGISRKDFWHRAAKAPGFSKWKYETAVGHLTGLRPDAEDNDVYQLTGGARAACRLLLGPPPDDPEYRRWWGARLVSVREMQAAGVEPTHAAAPPVPWEDEAPAAPAKAKKGAGAKKPPARAVKRK